jgi:hypothetical protein
MSGSLDLRTATWQDIESRKRCRDSEFLRGAIRETTYIVSLGILGYTERDAKDELAKLKFLQAIKRAGRKG